MTRVGAFVLDGLRAFFARRTRVLFWALLLTTAMPRAGLRAQDVAVRDLVIADAATPTRLMGYGLVTGLNGTGDRASTASGARYTVQSVVNLLRRFGVDVPAGLLRTRNVAAVLVTAEVSPYLRPGGRFDVSVASLGDAQSLRGGVLWMTPLVADAGGRALAGAQGNLLVPESAPNARSAAATTNSAAVPGGGVLEAELPRPAGAGGLRLLLRTPDVTTATRIAAAIDSATGVRGVAAVQDPGSITLAPKDTSGGSAAFLARILDTRVRPSRTARVVIDARSGAVVAGGNLQVGEASVSAGGLTVNIGLRADSTAARGDLRVPAGATVQAVAAALRGMQASAGEIAAIFTALRDVGAVTAEVVVR